MLIFFPSQRCVRGSSHLIKIHNTIFFSPVHIRRTWKLVWMSWKNWMWWVILEVNKFCMSTFNTSAMWLVQSLHNCFVTCTKVCLFNPWDMLRVHSSRWCTSYAYLVNVNFQQGCWTGTVYRQSEIDLSQLCDLPDSYLFVTYVLFSRWCYVILMIVSCMNRH